MVSHPGTGRVREALRHLDLYVVLDLFKTPSAALADYVLPAASWLEKPQAYSYLGFGRILTASPAILASHVPGEYDRRDEYLFWRGLGIRLGQSEHWPWTTSEDMLDHRFAPLGLGFGEFARSRAKAVLNPPEYRKFERIGFATPTSKVELYSTVLEGLGYDPLPDFREEPNAPAAKPQLAQEFPLLLINGARRVEYMHTNWRNVAAVRHQYPYPVVEVHPQTCSELGIIADQWVWIETRNGRVLQKCKPFDGIDPRVVHADFDWWYPEMEESDPSLFGVSVSNINVLLEGGDDVCGKEMGTWSLRFHSCRIHAAEPNDIPAELKGLSL
jgi:anaerobic selenocysteine-containing dehydrogenase